MSDNVVKLFTNTFRDPASALRAIADEIDAGKYGDVGSVGVALLGDRMECFGAGPDSEGPSIALLFHAAFLRISNAIEQAGRY